MSAGATARTAIDVPAAWRADDLADASAWTIELTDAQRDALAEVGRVAAARRRSIATLRADEVELPSLRETVARVEQILDRGHAFVLLRGFPVENLEGPEIELAYAALGLQLGTPVSQDAAGTLLGHVRDERLERTGPEVRRYRTRERQDFHTDGADIIGLLCLRTARRGGESKLASSYTVYNEILRRRPDLLEVLYEPMWWDRNGEESPGEPPAFALPVLHDVAGAPRIFYIGWYIRDAQRHPDVPRLTAAQQEALDLVESIANDPAHHVSMDFRPGDLQLLNNAKILHAREAYEDHEAPDARRHLLRLWLKAHAFDSVEARLGAGIPAREGRRAEAAAGSAAPAAPQRGAIPRR